MTGPTHVAIALAGTLAYTAATGDQPTTAGWIALILGSLAPDIDGGGTIARPGSLLGRLLPKWLARLLDNIGLFISGLIRKILGHRTATHWPAWAILMGFIALAWQWPWLLWFAVGYAWHIVGDFLTKDGVPLLGPIWTKNIRWSPIRTGTWPEAVISLALWGLIFYYGWAYIPAEARAWVTRFGHGLLSLI